MFIGRDDILKRLLFNVYVTKRTYMFHEMKTKRNVEFISFLNRNTYIYLACRNFEKDSDLEFWKNWNFSCKSFHLNQMMMRLYLGGNECCVYWWIKLIIDDNNNKPIFVPLFKLQYWKDKLSNKVLNQTVADAKASEYFERIITFPFLWYWIILKLGIEC